MKGEQEADTNSLQTQTQTQMPTEQQPSSTPSDAMTADGESTERYECPHPDCTKSFSRQEHLGRHKLNHWPKEIFSCTYVFPVTGAPCGKTFVRKDLLVRHEKRHGKVRNRLTSVAMPTADPAAPMTDVPTPVAVATTPEALMPGGKPKGVRKKRTKAARKSSSAVTLREAFADSPVPMAQSVPPQEQQQQQLPQQLPQQMPQAFYANSNHGSSSNFFDWLWAPDSKMKGGSVLTVPPHLQPQQMQQNTPQQMQQPMFQMNMDQMPSQQQTPLFDSMPAQMDVPPSGPQNGAPSQQQHAPMPPQQQQQQMQGQQAPMPQQQDLFSVDFFNPDPLQHFMRELNSSMFPFSAQNQNSQQEAQQRPPQGNANDDISPNSAPMEPMMNIQQFRPEANSQIPGAEQPVASTSSAGPPLGSPPLSDSRKSSVLDPARDNTKVVPQAKLRYYDTRGVGVVDNLFTQKSNVHEMTRQTSSPDSNSTITAAPSVPGGNGGVPTTNPSTNAPQDIPTIDETMMSYKEQLKSSLRAIPSLFSPDPRTKYELSASKCEALFAHIPEIKDVPLDILQMTLKSFWRNFQVKYGLLHKPSFRVNSEPDILILALIMTGAGYLGPKYRQTIADPICGPLRWMIFSHPDFQPPSHTYIIQALLLLENYEKSCTNRYLHERSYLHHGTTIQLLRRTPSLGGHPLRDKKRSGRTDEETRFDDFISEDKIKNVITRWVEFESLKRVAFFAFYMDVTHAVIFGYMNLFISFKQIHLDLPCPDELWESYDLSFEKLTEFGFFGDNTGKANNVTFLAALKCLIRDVLKKLNNRNVPTFQSGAGAGASSASSELNMLFGDSDQSVFGKKILLAGILSMMYQCQEEAFDPLIGVGAFIKGVGEESTKTMTWREVMSFAINYWLSEVQHSCCKLSQCVISDNPVDEDDVFLDNPLMQVCDWNYNSRDCKLPVYHMAQVILRIFHHDYYIFAGVPWRMNVRVGEAEYQSVYQKILNFARDKYNGGVTMVYAFQFLFQMFIRVDEQDPSVVTVDHSYDINTDIYMTRPNTVALTTLLIWSLNFVLYGPEATIWDNDDGSARSPVNGSAAAAAAAAAAANAAAATAGTNNSSAQNPRRSISSYASDSDPQNLIRHEYNQKAKAAYTPLESFDAYLIRMYGLLHIDDSQDVISFQNEVFHKANLLGTIPHKQNLCGLLTHVIGIFAKSYWDLGKEFERLLENCLERSLGKTSHTCYNMYDV